MSNNQRVLFIQPGDSLAQQGGGSLRLQTLAVAVHWAWGTQEGHKDLPFWGK